MKNFICRLFSDRKGATAIEYGLIVALIVVAMIASLNNVANKTINMWSTVANKVQTSG